VNTEDEDTVLLLHVGNFLPVT